MKKHGVRTLTFLAGSSDLVCSVLSRGMICAGMISLPCILAHLLEVRGAVSNAPFRRESRTEKEKDPATRLRL